LRVVACFVKLNHKTVRYVVENDDGVLHIAGEAQLRLAMPKVQKADGVPIVDLPDDELAAVTAAIRGVIEGDRFPHAPRLVPLRAALARLQAAGIGKSIANISAAQKPPAVRAGSGDRHERRPFGA
jgi:hypothetical protein